MLNPLLKNHDFVMRLEFKKADTDKYIENAKQNIQNYSINEEWIAYIHKASSSKPKNFIVPVLSILPALSQIVQLFGLKYFIQDCGFYYNGLASLNDPSVCFEHNDYINFFSTSFFWQEDSSSCSSTLLNCFAVGSMVNFLLFAFVIHKLFTYSKYPVRMMGIRAKLTKVFTNWDYYWLFILIVNTIVLGLLRTALSYSFCYKSLVGNYQLMYRVLLNGQSPFVSFVQYFMIYSCFAVLLYRYYTNPWQTYVKMKDFLERAESLDYNPAKVDYVITKRHAVKVIRFYFTIYKGKEEDKIILCAIMDHLLAKKFAFKVQKENKETSEVL